MDDLGVRILEVNKIISIEHSHLEPEIASIDSRWMNRDMTDSPKELLIPVTS